MGTIEQLRNVVTLGIDTHIHVGDEDHKDGGLQRMWTAQEADNLCLPVVAKAHFLPFIPESEHVYGSMTLNESLNPSLIERASNEMSRPWVVWFPSLNARAHHEVVTDDEVWKKLFEGIDIGKPISVIDESDKLTTQATETVDAIRETGAILASGHLSSDEVGLLIPEAIRKGVRAVVLTHVSSRHNRISIQDQIRFIALGVQAGIPVYAEHCAITWIDGKPEAYELVRDFVEPIQAVGVNNCILSSDCGRVVPAGSKKPVTPIGCLMTFLQLLIKHGLSLQDIEQMVVTNPRNLLQSNNA